MTGVHQFLALASALACVVLVGASVWSWLAARRSGGARDHRLAVDRAILVAVAAITAAGLVGVVLFVSGSRPGDGLHLLYGVAAVVTPLVGWWLAVRRGEGSEPVLGRRRARRNGVIAIASLILLGVILRLFLTG